MTDTNATHNAARRSLFSVWAAAAAITANHLFTLGPRALGLGLFLAIVPTLLMLHYRRSRSQLTLGAYILMSLWIVVGFGLYKGLWKGVLRLFFGTMLGQLSTTYPQPVVGPYLFEATGILMFIATLFVGYYAVQLLQATRGRSVRARSLTVYGTIAAMLILTAYAAIDRDKWSPPAGGVVTIGVIAPVTGPYAVLGSSFVKAVEMARDDLPRSTRYSYRLVIEDTGPDPARARDVVRRVVARSDAVIGAVSLIGEVTKPFATAERIPHLCICTVTRIGDGAYNFTNIPSPEAEASRWVEEARARGIRTVAIIAQDYPSINNHVKALKTRATRDGLSVTRHTRFADTVSDFRPMIEAARATKPDVYYIEALEPSLDLLGQTLRDVNVRNVASVVAPSVSGRPDLFEGVWYTDSDLADSTFRTRFERKYPGVRFATHMMPYAYDSFKMIVSAYESGVNPAVFLRNIARYEGAAGTVIKSRGSGNFQSAPAVWVIRDGRPTLLSERQPRRQIARRSQ